MRRLDWIILALLLAGVTIVAWPSLRATPVGRFLAGDCEWVRDQGVRPQFDARHVGGSACVRPAAAAGP